MQWPLKMKNWLWIIFSCSSLVFAADTSPKQYGIQQFLNTKKYAGKAFSFNEEKVLFSSDESGVFNVYSLPVLGGTPTQLTHSKNHAFIILSGFPNDERFLFTSDGLGNELDHIFLRELDGSVRDLTPFANAKSCFAQMSHDQKSFFFLSNKRDPKFMDLYEMDIQTLQPQMIYQNEDGLNVSAISSDKRQLALTKRISAANTETYLYEVSQGNLKSILPHRGEVNDHPVEFSLDGAYLYYLTDQDSEFTYLKRLHLETGLSEIIESYPWDISFCGFSKMGRYRITGINEDGKTVVQIHDQMTHKKVNLPKALEGEITEVGIAKSEKSMLVYVNGDRSPSNLYYYEFESQNFRQLTQSLSPEINAEDLVEAKTIRYPSYDGTLIPALYYKPKNGKTIGTLLWIHGGPGGQSRRGYHYLIQYLVNQGYSVLCVNNRGSSGYGKSFFQAADHKHGEADLDDCIWAKYFLVSKEGINPDKVGMIGGSYGGYMTLAALAFRPNEMALGVDMFGVSNWIRTLTSIPSWWESHRNILYKKIGNPETESAYLNSISPLFHADRIKRPLLVIQGANDPRVLKIESDQIIEEVKKNGVPHQYLVFDDEGHGFKKKQNQMTAAIAILNFLNEHLK